VTSDLPYPYLGFSVSVGTKSIDDLAYLDTGFEGGMMIPEDSVDEFLAPPTPVPYRMADGVIISVPSWSGEVHIDDHRFRIEVIALGQHYLLGRDILDKMEVCFLFGREVRHRFRDEVTQ
jgi:predicted aspartyl protease